METNGYFFDDGKCEKLRREMHVWYCFERMTSSRHIERKRHVQLRIAQNISNDK